MSNHLLLNFPKNHRQKQKRFWLCQRTAFWMVQNISASKFHGKLTIFGYQIGNKPICLWKKSSVFQPDIFNAAWGRYFCWSVGQFLLSRQSIPGNFYFLLKMSHQHSPNYYLYWSFTPGNEWLGSFYCSNFYFPFWIAAILSKIWHIQALTTNFLRIIDEAINGGTIKYLGCYSLCLSM